MAIEIVRNTFTNITGNFWPEHHLFNLASMMSLLTNVEIIDSWGVDHGQYIGDPIADAEWTAYTDIGDQGYFVIQPTNPTYSPTWQAIFHHANRYYGFDDPSGNDYGNEGTAWRNLIRFAPEGGWNTTSKDFATPSRASQNRYPGGALNPSARTNTFYIHCDEDTLILQSRYADRAWEFYSVLAYLGDYTRRSDSQTNPRCFICKDGGAYMSPAYQCTTAGNFVPESGFETDGIGFLDESNTYRHCSYTTKNGDKIISPLTQPTTHGAIPKVDIYPVQIKPTSAWDGYLGDLRLVGKTFGPGPGYRFDLNRWISTYENYGCSFGWDGSSSQK